MATTAEVSVLFNKASLMAFDLEILHVFPLLKIQEMTTLFRQDNNHFSNECDSTGKGSDNCLCRDFVGLECVLVHRFVFFSSFFPR